jgi:hypothetical protein
MLYARVYMSSSPAGEAHRLEHQWPFRITTQSERVTPSAIELKATTSSARRSAVIDPAGQLVCLTVYKRGAEEVVRRLAA